VERLWRPSESGSLLSFIKRNSGSVTLSILSAGEGAAGEPYPALRLNTYKGGFLSGERRKHQGGDRTGRRKWTDKGRARNQNPQ